MTEKSNSDKVQNIRTWESDKEPWKSTKGQGQRFQCRVLVIVDGGWATQVLI